MLSGLPHSVEERKEKSVEGSYVKKEESVNERLNGLGNEEVRGADSGSPQCTKLQDNELLALELDGDVVIGGFFPLHFVASELQHSYNRKPQVTPCSA